MELKRHLAASHHKHVHRATISRTLRRRGFAQKQVCPIYPCTKLNSGAYFNLQIQRPAREQDEEDRARFQMIVGEHYSPELLVFGDETHLNRFVTRRRFGWAPIGLRARRRDFFVRGKRCVFFLSRFLCNADVYQSFDPTGNLSGWCTSPGGSAQVVHCRHISAVCRRLARPHEPLSAA